MTALFESFSLTITLDVFSLSIPTFLHFSQVGKPVLESLQHWDTLQTPQFIAHRLTCPLETVCILLLDLVVALTKSLLVLFFSLEDTLVQAHSLSQQPSLRDFP